MTTRTLSRNQFGDEKNAGNLLSDEDAMKLLTDMVSNDRLRLHMKQVAEVMKQWALQKEDTDELIARKWYQAGLLHDADWEKYPDDHCKIIIEKLEELQIDPDVIHTIASHGPGYFGVEPISKMDKMIYAFDELSGFIHAASLMRPTGYEGMEVKSVLKKLKDKAFAANVKREDIQDAISRIEPVTLDEIIGFIIMNQKNVS